MKIVLSRKGFDSSYGGVASPIFPDGRMVSLPIPSKDDRIAYCDLNLGGIDLGKLVSDLTRKPKYQHYRTHLDPDLTPGLYPRQKGWRPLFGQVGSAQGHLAGQGVGVGDIFLFFGWFREVELSEGRYRFREGSPDQHVLFGWLQVGEVFSGVGTRVGVPTWACYHPHLDGTPYGANNTVYLSSERLVLEGAPSGLPGAGIFPRYAAQLRLSTGDTRGTWKLPRWLYPTVGKQPLTYHGNLARWSLQPDGAILEVVRRGQEFVFDTKEYPEATDWLEGLIRQHSGA